MSIVNSDTNYAVVSDHLNTPRRMTDSDGSLVWQWGYNAFGEEQPTVATRKFNKVAAMDGDLEMNLRYPGQYFDRESGMHYNGFRTFRRHEMPFKSTAQLLTTHLESQFAVISESC